MKSNAVLLPALVLSMLLAMQAFAGKPGESPGRKHTTLERMTTERLKAAHGDVLRIQADRRQVEMRSGLTDYRAILHAHAEDSSHTGGTRPEMLEDAKRAKVQIIFLSDHYRPPRNFMDSWRGLRDGVLFVPGSETHGLLVHPETSIVDVMDEAREALIKATTAGEGLAFLSHVEDRVNAPMDGLTGMEIYNRHADAKDDMAAVFGLVSVVLDPAKLAVMEEALRRYPAELLASQLDYPELYLRKWDVESQKRRVVGIAANDCHHNQVFVAKMVDEETVLVGTIVDDDDNMRRFTAAQFPGIREMTKGRKPGDLLARLDFDPYVVSFHNVSTHILAPELSESAARHALKAGHAYVSHDWMCDPTGFVFGATLENDGVGETPRAIMGDEIAFTNGLTLVAEFPVSCDIRVIKNGEEIHSERGRILKMKADGPGVYRVEGWLTVDTEERPWIYANPIYVR